MDLRRYRDSARLQISNRKFKAVSKTAKAKLSFVN